MKQLVRDQAVRTAHSIACHVGDHPAKRYQKKKLSNETLPPAIHRGTPIFEFLVTSKSSAGTAPAMTWLRRRMTLHSFRSVNLAHQRPGIIERPA
jgi:hypothetical protein